MSLHLLHTLPDVRLLAAWMAKHQLQSARRHSDVGDAFHGLLRAALGSAAPQPFRYLGALQGLLAYTSLDADAMHTKLAQADPLAAETLGLIPNGQHDGFRLRTFPTNWPAGKVLGFEVRLRPTVRTAKGERDAFLHALEESGSSDLPQRQAVYVQWLREHLAPREAAAREPWQGAVELLEDVCMAGYSRQQIVRRARNFGGERRLGRVIDGPDVLLKGYLRVLDPVAFSRLLVRGVGRHRAFGYGMLLLTLAAK